MKTIKHYAMPIVALFVMILASCSNDEVATYSTATLTNTELMTILKQKGYTFNDEGKLELNDMAMNTKSLDLSGTMLKDVSGLDILPNLTEVKLANNGYKMAFDFTKLPTQITSIDLTGNELYEFPGLTKEDEDGNITVLHNLKKLYLPNGAKYNEDEIVSFYRTVKDVDMQMTNDAGKLEKYNTLRYITDETLLEPLKKTFSDLFVKDENGRDAIDISRRLVNPGQKTSSIGFYPFPNTYEGAQYVLHNKGYEGTTAMFMSSDPKKRMTIPYLRVPKSVQVLALEGVNTPNGIILDDAINLRHVQLQNNSGMKSVDLSTSIIMGQRSIKKDINSMEWSFLSLENCEDLEQIILPEKAKYFNELHFFRLPKLKDLNLSKIEGVETLTFIELPSCKLIYPINLNSFLGVHDGNEQHLKFAIDKPIFDKAETTDFFKRNGKNIDRNTHLTASSAFLSKEIHDYDWTK